MSTSETTSMTPQRTALWEEHRDANARMVPFAGWEMPVQYAGVIAEVAAVRQNCGVFDVSHMGQFDIAGAGVTEALNRIVSADWSQIAPGRVAYALLLNESGGVVDDVMGYRVGENEWLVVVNASRADVDELYLRARLPPSIQLQNRYTLQAMLAIQGPNAQDILRSLTALDLASMRRRDCAQAVVAGAPGLLARGGYTGSDGFELMFEARDAPRVWGALLEKSVVPCGLGARDVLRMEAALPLYGHELREAWTPFESGCAFAVKVDKEEFVGRAALLEKRASYQDGTPPCRIRALKMEGKAIPREGYAIWKGDVRLGEITSGTLSPTVGAGIALAMLPHEMMPGEPVEVEIRGARHQATIVAPPFVAHARAIEIEPQVNTIQK